MPKICAYPYNALPIRYRNIHASVRACDWLAVSAATPRADVGPRRYSLPCAQLRLSVRFSALCVRAKTRRGCVRTCDGSHVRAFECLAAVHARGAVFIARLTGGASARLRRCRRCVGWRALAAGATWRNLTSSAPWAVRNGHTTVVGAASAIYVIGGYNGNIYLNDVWVSTDGGAHQTRQCWGILWDTRGYSGVLAESSGVLRGYSEYSGSLGMLTGSVRGNGRAHKGCHGRTRCTHRVV